MNPINERACQASREIISEMKLTDEQTALAAMVMDVVLETATMTLEHVRVKQVMTAQDALKAISSGVASTLAALNQLMEDTK